MRIKVNTRAEFDIADAIAYYEALSLDAVLHFDQALAVAFDSLGRFWKYELKYKAIRTYHIKPYPYRIHYRVSEDEIVIEALIHEQAERQVD